MSKDLIVIDNSIVTSAYNLTLNEQRLVYCALKKIPKGEQVDPETPFYVSRDDFIELGADPSNAAKEIRQATRDLMKKSIKILNPLGEVEIPWLSEVLRYDKNAEQKLKEKYPDPEDHSEYITALRLYNLFDALPSQKHDANIVARIVFHKKMMPLLSELRKNFTQFLADDVSEFSSIYSFRVYQLMMQYKSTGYVKISLDDLRYMLVLKNKYNLVSDLKRWVIDAAVEEINEKSPYNVQYELIKKGRKFVALELKFYPKGEKPKEIKMSPAQISMFAGLLANMPELGEYAPVGTSMAEYAAMIAEDLENPEKVEFYRPYLKKLGFVER